MTEAKTFTVGLYEYNTATSAGDAVQHDVNGSKVNWTETITVAANSATGTATFTGLEVGKTYRVYELNGENQLEANALYEEYKVSYSDGEGVQITRTALNGETSVNNNKETTTINATKTWGDGNSTPPTGTEITWTIKATVDTDTDVTSSIITPEADRSKTAMATPWSTSWSDLPKYHDGKEVTYVVTETSAKYGTYEYTAEEIAAANESVDSSTTAGTFAFTNSLPTTEITGTKVWKITGDVPTTNPTLKLTRMSAKAGSKTETAVNGNEGVEFKETAATTDTLYQPSWQEGTVPKTFTYSNLPKYDNEGNEYTYSVTEASFEFTVNGENNSSTTYTYTVTENGIVTSSPAGGPDFKVSQSDNIITNEELTKFEFEKEWRLNETPVVWDESVAYILVTLTRKATGTDAPADQSVTFKVTKDGISIEGKSGIGDNFTIKKTTASGYHYEITGLDAVTEGGLKWTYSITETAMKDAAGNAVTGYNDPRCENSSGEQHALDSQASGTKIINNKSTVSLPSTGGTGTNLFYTLGSILVGLAGVMLVMRKKRRTI